MKDTRTESLYYSNSLRVFCVVGVNKFHYTYSCNDPKGIAGIVDFSKDLEVKDLIKFLVERQFEYLGKL